MEKRWLVIESCSERYDMNLELHIEKGTIESLEESEHNFYNDHKKEVLSNGIVLYHKSSSQRDLSNQTINGQIDSWEKINHLFTIINFDMKVLIPFELLMDDKFSFYDPIVQKRLKFGIIDLKKGDDEQ